MTGAAICGLGMTELGRVYGASPRRLAADAVRLAVADAGLTLDDLDGLLVSPGLTGSPGTEVADVLGLRDLRLLAQINALGASAVAMVSHAAMAVATAAATTVACVFADAPLRPGTRAGSAFDGRGRSGRPVPAYGMPGLLTALGYRNVTVYYALAARRYMQAYGTTSEQFGAIAVSTRRWAAGNPRAQMREEMTLADHQRSRMVAEPLRLLDCCLVSNGAIAVVVTRAEAAADLARPPVHIRGFGQGHPGHVLERGSPFGLRTGAATSGPAAMRMAGVGPADIDVCQIYDCYTYTVAVTLEDYGLCGRGEAGELAAAGELGPGGRLPTNTGGGQLSGYYMWGMTPLSEAVIQARGEGGARQVDRAEMILVSGNGGILAHHGTMILSPHPTAAGRAA